MALELKNNEETTPRTHPGDTPMNRIMGLTVAVLVPMSLATTAHAQSYYGDGTVGSDYGTVMAGQPYGGFGHQYSPAIPAGGVIVDQWGGLHAVGYAVTAPSPAVVAAQPQPRATATRSRSRRVTAQPRYVLPSGSLGWSGGNGGMLYSPETRYSSYGSGYNVGPYGVVNHNTMWKW
jgi:hypothetical protein